jgi:hypothetical protein
VRPADLTYSGTRVPVPGWCRWGIIVAPLALVHDLPVALLLFATGAFVWAPYTTVEMSVIQRLVPPAQHGVVIGTRRALLVAAFPAGTAVGGAVTTPANARLILTISALACTVAGLCCIATPALRAVPAGRRSPNEHHSQCVGQAGAR